MKIGEIEIKQNRIEKIIEDIGEWKKEINRNPAFDKFLNMIDPSMFPAQFYQPKHRAYGEVQTRVQNQSLFSLLSNRAIALYGPPGTGKTILAEATANAFLSIIRENTDLPPYSGQFAIYQMNDGSTKASLYYGLYPKSNNGVLEIRGVPMLLMTAMVLGHIIALDEFTQAPTEIQSYLNSIFDVEYVDTPAGRLPVSPLFRIIAAYNPETVSNSARELAITIENRIGAKIEVPMSPKEDIYEIVKNVLPEAEPWMIKYASSLVSEAREDGSYASIRQAISLVKQMSMVKYKLLAEEFDRAHESLLKELNRDSKAVLANAANRLWLKFSDPLVIYQNKEYRSLISFVYSMGVRNFQNMVYTTLNFYNYKPEKIVTTLP